MTDPTARDLIQRLADALEAWLQAHDLGGIPPQDGADAALIGKARAYLATPEPAAEALEAQPRSWAGMSTHDDWPLFHRVLERLQELEGWHD